MLGALNINTIETRVIENAKVEAFSLFNVEQSKAVLDWLKAIVKIDGFEHYSDVIESAIKYWSERSQQSQGE